MWKNIFIDNNVMHRKINSLKTSNDQVLPQ